MKTYSLLVLLLVVCVQQNLAQSPLSPDESEKLLKQETKARARQENMLTWSKGSGLIQSRFQFRVTMKDGQEIIVSSLVFTDHNNRRNYILWEDRSLAIDAPKREKKIYPSGTTVFYRYDRTTTSIVEAYITDSAWLFKEGTGKITLMYTLDENGYTDSRKIAAFQFHGGIPEPFNEKRLEQIMINYPKALKALRKKHYQQAVSLYNNS